ncbi:hypothetical protein ATY35_01065 [Vibrio cidicii]|uniref:Uncharacterized protein n=1 Tax=Vibrio cidicii TaxID=1763883 RepID=A0ABR5W8U6_9VIBR|nr:hypothetical protein ATY35_01065 [Vibrio cidicii]
MHASTALEIRVVILRNRHALSAVKQCFTAATKRLGNNLILCHMVNLKELWLKSNLLKSNLLKSNLLKSNLPKTNTQNEG